MLASSGKDLVIAENNLGSGGNNLVSGGNELASGQNELKVARTSKYKYLLGMSY